MTAKKIELVANNPEMGGLGLEGIGDLSGLLDQPDNTPSGPLELPLDLIDEDVEQPRKNDNPGFSPESIAELGATIAVRGVKSPISVRENPEKPNRYIINHGARRLRAAKWAGQATIPGFIDDDYTHADQVVENLQRDELTPREIANFIGRQLAAGIKKGVIALSIGKSSSFVSQHVTLLDLPEPVAAAFNSGRTNDVTVVNELVTAYKKFPEEVGAWVEDDNQELNRGSVKRLREFLEEKGKQNESPAIYGDERERNNKSKNSGRLGNKKDKVIKPSSDKLNKAAVMVEYGGRSALLMLFRRPSGPGRAWIKYEDNQELDAELEKIKILAIMEDQVFPL